MYCSIQKILVSECYFHVPSTNAMGLIRIRGVIMFYHHSNNRVTHFYIHVNPIVSVSDKYRDVCIEFGFNVFSSTFFLLASSFV